VQKLNIAASRDCAVINPGGLFWFFLGKQKEQYNRQSATIKEFISNCKTKLSYSSFFLDKKRSKKIKDKRMAPPVYPASAT